MKIGDLVRYKPHPHVELHISGMAGIILSESYESTNPDSPDILIDVMWNKRRPQADVGNSITWEYADDLEVIK